MPSRLRTILDPARLQSNPHDRGWFEGWYFKLVDEAGVQPIAVIPGVARDKHGAASHSFVQVLRPGHPARYERYSFEDFRWAPECFDISVGPNRFSATGLTLELPATSEHPATTGTVAFAPWRTWPVSLLSPGIMGWYRYVPRMECYHAVLSLDHALWGSLLFGTERASFDNGRGYAEKDWGHSFPSSWVWLQTNRFVDDDGAERPGVSLTMSIARIPWLGSSFTGHITGLALDDGRLFRFATYTGARLRAVETGPGEAAAVISDHRHELVVVTEGGSTASLKAPTIGEMTARDDESLEAFARVELRDRHSDEVIFAGTGSCAGLEVMNERGELQTD